MARAIKRFRSTLGDTQQQFAIRTGLAVTTIGRYETGWYPKADVLAKFSTIANENHLPLFVEIFERDLPAEPFLLQDELPALLGLLRNALSELKATALDVDRGRIALACLTSLREPSLEKLKKVLEHDLSPVEALVERYAGIVSWNRDSEGEAQYLKFIRNPTLETGREYARYTLGEPYEIGFERSWIDSGKEAALNYLMYFRHVSGQFGWGNPKDKSLIRRPRGAESNPLPSKIVT